MTVSNTVSRNQYTATASQTVFPYTFEVFVVGDLVVDQNGTILSEGTHYTVSGVGDDIGGNVTLLTGATSGDILTLYRDMDLERLNDYQQNGDFLADEVNDDLDRLWLAMQQNKSDNQSAIRAPLGDTILNSTNTELAAPSVRASTVLGFTPTGAIDYVSGALPTGTFRSYSTVAAMVIDTAIVLGDWISVEDYATGNNSGYLFFKAVAAATGTADGGSYIDLTGSSLQARQNFPIEVDVKTFGADNTNECSSNIQAAIDYGKFPVVGTGTFLVSTALDIQVNDVTLKLENIKRTAAGSCVVVGTYTGTAATNVTVQNFRFTGAFEGPGYRSATEVIGIDDQSSLYCHYWFDKSINLKSVYQSKAREGTGSDHPTTERTFIYRCETFEVDYPIVALPNTVDLGAPTYTTYAGRRELWISHLNLARAITNIKLEDVDGVQISQFTLFQNPNDASTRLDNIELHDCEHVVITNGNCFEAGRNGIRFSDCKNLNISNVNVVWSGEQSASAGIYGFGRDTNAKNDNVRIQAIVEGCSGDGVLIDGTSGTFTALHVEAVTDDNSNNHILGGASLDGVYSGVNITGAYNISGSVNNRGRTHTNYGLEIDSTVTEANVALLSREDVTGDYLAEDDHNIVVKNINNPTSTGVRTVGVTSNITAFAGGGQSSAVELTNEINVITAVATAGDSVKLPTAAIGKKLTIVNNDSADACDVFPNTSDNLGAGVNVAVSLAAGSNITYVAIGTTSWESI